VTFDERTKVEVSAFYTAKNKFIKLFCKHMQQRAFCLHTWGEAGTIKLQNLNKVDNYGVTCIFVEYANHHEGCCYRMWDPNIRHVHKLHDIIWLHRMFWNDKNTSSELLEPPVYLEDFEVTMVKDNVGPHASNPKEWEGTGTIENAPAGSPELESEPGIVTVDLS
jgi:hypothetical protein